MLQILQTKCRRCRSAGEKLFLKGERCHSAKCAIVRRNYRPGVHGPKRAPRLSEFGRQLKAKQSAKRSYGVMERQFANYFKNALTKEGDTGEILGGMLENRLDNVVYRLGWAKSRGQARQYVSHGHILIDGKKVDIPSYQVKVGQVISLKERSKQSPNFKNLAIALERQQVPSWLALDKAKLEGKVLGQPKSEELAGLIDAKLIVEYYSR